MKRLLSIALLITLAMPVSAGVETVNCRVVRETAAFGYLLRLSGMTEDEALTELISLNPPHYDYIKAGLYIYSQPDLPDLKSRVAIEAEADHWGAVVERLCIKGQF